jgi:hypothetical protein
MIPGRTLHRLATRICSAKTREWLVDPILADLQKEYREAVQCGRVWRSRWILTVGYVGLLAAVALYLMDRLTDARLKNKESDPVLRWVVLLILTTAGATIALIAAMKALPLHTDWEMHRSHVGYLIARSLPLAIAIGVPCALGWVCSATTLSRRSVASILGIVVLLSAISFTTSQWVVPKLSSPLGKLISDRGIYGLFTGPGPERYFSSTREERRRMALASPYPNHSVTLSSRFVSYSSGSISIAPIVLGTFVLSICWRRRLTRTVSVLVGVGALAGYLLVMALSDDPSLFRLSERIVDTRRFNPIDYVIWLPNAVLAVLSIVMFAASGPAEAGHYDSRSIVESAD